MKKGFTIVELLATIVVMALIALIVVPQILNYIEESKIRSAVVSGGNYVKAVNNKISLEESKGILIPYGEYVIGENEIEIDATNYEDIIGGYRVSTTGVVWAGLCVKNYPVEYSEGKAKYNKTATYCQGDETPFIEPDATLLRSICDDSSIYNTESSFKIKKVEDLACLTKTVSDGKNFNGKTIYLLEDIDLSNTKSYDSVLIKTYGDLNGDGTTDGLKEELSKAAGFKPIGNSSRPFNGAFIGYGHTISNLTINRPSQSYVGLFGYNNGTVKGVKLKNVSIVGGDYTGGIVGNNHNVLTDIEVKGSVIGNTRVGGVVGYADYNYGNQRDNNLIFSGTVKGSNYIGGIAGGGGWSPSGVVYNSTIQSTATSGSVYIGKGNGDNSGSFRTNNVTLTYNTSLTKYGADGISVDVMRLHNVDDVLDTYIGGDNDSDGYYFDYDKSKNIVLYSTDRKEIRNKLKGDGSQENPYVIKTAEDWRMASATISSAKYYKLEANIDFGNDLLYAMGTENNKFKGTFDGNMKTLSSIKMDNYDYAGTFGYNTGTIKSIKFEDATIKGTNQYTGVVAGYNTGTITGIAERGITVTGKSYVGGVVGNNYRVLTNCDVRGSITGTGSRVGGVVGYADYNYGNQRDIDLLFSGTVKGDNYVGGIAGGGGWSPGGAVYNSTIQATATSGSVYVGKGNGDNSGSFRTSNVTLTYNTSLTKSGTDGVSVDVMRLHNVDDVLDTYIGGDNNNDGYYFDYDSSKKIVLYNTKLTPIKNTLTGDGTSDNPYLIKNAADWKMASATVNQGKYYKLDGDIDFENDCLYAFGTNTNKFNGVMNGYMHTLSNINLENYDYAGLFGYNTGTIKALKFEDATIKGTNQYTGVVAGYNNGTITGIVERGITVTGKSYVGGVVGNNYRVLTNCDVRGSITGTGSRVGGVTGYADYSTGNQRDIDLLFSGTVKGNNYVGGITGGGSWSPSGIVYDATVQATTTSGTVYIGKGNPDNSGSFKTKNVTLTYTSGLTKSGGSDGQAVTTMRLNNVDDVVDTYIAGDNNSDGFYFDYDSSNKIILYSTLTNPIRNTLSGEGTSASPYIINSMSDWKMATATLGTTGKHYSITADLNFGNDCLYAFGTSTNKFNGVINGNMHTLSNINLESYDYAGLFGYNNGTIKAMKFSNATIKSVNEYAGAVVGYNNGTVTGIVGRNITVTGKNYIGGIVGYNRNVLLNGDVRGNITGTGNYVGGVTGYAGYNTGSQRDIDLVFSGTVKGNNYVGGITGGGSWSPSGIIYDSTVQATTTSGNVYAGKGNADNSGSFRTSNVTLTYTSGLTKSGTDGQAVTTMRLNNVDDIVDTYIGGDNNSDGFYFDYDSSNKIILYSTATTPITNTLGGSGTADSPYIIRNLADWRMATATLGTTGKYYSIAADLNFGNDSLYTLGTSNNKFNGTMDGYMHTLSNINLENYDYAGLFGYNNGTIKGIKFNGVTIKGSNEYAGAVVGYNNGTVTGIVGRNITVNGKSYVGGIVGYNRNVLLNGDVRGNITGTGNYVGGVTGYAGYNTGSQRDIDLVFSGTVKGNNYVGGITGGGSWNPSGVIYNSTVQATTTSGNVYAGKGNADNSGTFKTNNVTITYGSGLSRSGKDGTDVATLTLDAVNDVIDTSIGGDNNSDGYYFITDTYPLELARLN